MRDKLSIILTIILWISAIIYHIWTTVTALEYTGFLGALITFLAPGISSMFWNGVVIQGSGFLNAYTLYALGICVVYGLLVLTDFRISEGV